MDGKIVGFGGKRALAALACAVAFAGLLAMGALGAATFAPQQAWARTVEAPTTVSDDITRLHVNKLDSQTREFVVGAKMAIIRNDTGEVVESWTTDGSTHKIEKRLDVGVVYVLRELEAPDGYGKVGDTQFLVNEVEGTGITIISKDDETDLSEGYVVSLFDPADALYEDRVVTRTRPDTVTTPDGKEPAPKTGDETPLELVGGLALLGLLAIGALQLVKRRIS